MRLVLDASIAASWLFEDEAHAVADQILNVMEDGQALVPAIWPVEIASVLSSSVRHRRMKSEEIEPSVAYLRKFDIVVDDMAIDPAALAGIALNFAISVYDAMYLDLARRHALPLATLDKKLSAAASQAGVKIFK